MDPKANFFLMPIRYFFFLIVVITACEQPIGPELELYPAIGGLTASDIYSVEVNNEEVWTEKIRTDMNIEELPEWFTSTPYTSVQQELHITNFSCSGPVGITIRVDEPVNTARIRPLSRGIEPLIDDNKVSFTIPGPDKLYIEINDLAPLCFFANPLEGNVPDDNDPDIRYFGPGVHSPGMMTLGDNDEIYIAGGAIVYGGIRINNSSNIKIHGRGILDGNFEHHRMVLIENARNIEFNGIMIRNGRSWTNTVINSDSVTYQDVKVISFGPGGDGINPLGSRHFRINECFLRCTDDCIAIKSPDTTHVVRDVLVTNNTMIGYAFSDGITIGFETNGPVIENVTVRNCDILMARGGSRVDGHSAFSVICDGPAVIRDVLYENIRAESPILKLFELHITDGTKYGINPPGHIENIYLKHIFWTNPKPIILHGYDEGHRVRNVTFDQCMIGEEALLSTDAEVFQINEYVDNVQFK